MLNAITYLIFLLVLVPFSASAQLQPAKIFSSNMVLQRNQPIHIWGKATPGQSVSVFFANEKKAVIAKGDSTWSVYFKKQKANVQPQTLVIATAEETIELQNILIGDIWVCSGQSNMEWTMQKEMFWKSEIKNTDQPLIRFTNPPPAGRYVYGSAYSDSLNRRLNKEDFYLWNGWKQSDSNSIKTMSAIAYYFAKQVVQKTGVPIGLINLSIGGAPIETFISKEAMLANKKFAGKVNGDWLKNTNLPQWIKERGAQNVGANTNGFKDEQGLNHAYKPGFAFEAGINKILPLPVKGILWHQGESNSLETARVQEYRELQKLMITDYRRQWNQPGMPFYWVQLSSIDTTHYQAKYWPQFRDEQRLLINEVKNAGMAVSSDIGAKKDVHPTNKKWVGERLARWALNKEYGHKNIMPSGPLPLKAIYKNSQVIISFKYAKGLMPVEGNEIKGFSLDGISQAAAVVQHGKVVIISRQKTPFVYYGWKPFSDGNLVNAENLPASTFKIAVK